jgi:imidazolonepropionase
VSEIRCDLLIHSAGELCTMAGGEGPRHGPDQGDLGVISGGAVAITDGRIVAVGESDGLRRTYAADDEVDAGGRCVIPGFVDAHTHLVFAATREEEWERRCLGATYQEIYAAGGGIQSSVRSHREASNMELLERAGSLRRTALLHGTTTMEVKSGYGLNLEEEVRALEVVRDLDDRGDLVPTFLGAHAIPEEFAGRGNEYVDVVVEEMIPAVAAKGLAKFCDVFCEEAYFDVAQSRRVLEAAQAHGMALRMHADELSCCGGAQLAAETGCTSADHLLEVGEEGIAAMAGAGVIATLLPGTSFFLGMRKFAPARAMIDAGVPVALATDCNPGSSMLPNLQQALAIGCIGLGLTAAEALVGATRNAAWSVGMGEEVGTLEPGRRADLVVLDVDNHRQLPYLHGLNHAAVVVHHGEVVAP